MGRRKPVKKNPIGDSERFYGKSKEGLMNKSVFAKSDPRFGTSPTVSKYPERVDIYSMINSVTKKQIEEYSNVGELPVLIRDLLFEFAEDWSNLDRDHSNYLSQVPVGYSKFDAALIGDMLYWMITGANERSKVKSGKYIADHHWPSKIEANCPNFTKRLEAMPGLTIHDLAGLHIRLLNNLPINNYNRYTIAQVTLDDPQIGEQVFPSPSPLSSEEHEAILTLTRLIEAGDMRKFSVALIQSTKTELSGVTGGGGVGGHIFQAFEMAKASVDAYKQGDVNLARKHLHSIQDEYKMNLSTFQTGLKDMFVLTASAFHAAKSGSRGAVVKAYKGQHHNQHNKGSKGNDRIKGSPVPLLVSLDTSMPPLRTGWKGANMHAAMKAANQTNIKISYDTGTKDYKIEKAQATAPDGTLGLTAAVAHNQNILTTNWLGLFHAALSGKNPLADDYGETKIISTHWPSGSDSISIRFIIHANLAEGIGNDYLVPKGLLTVTARKGQGDTSWVKAMKAYGGGSGKGMIQPIIDLFVEDLGRAKQYSDAFTDESLDAGLKAMADENEDIEQILEDEMHSGKRGPIKNPPGALGKAVVVDVVPRGQIQVRTITEKPPPSYPLKYLKMIRDEEGLKELYAQYGKGQHPVKSKKGKGWRWKGKTFATKKQVADAVNKSGNQVDKGHPKIQVLYAKRKDNGNLVPHRIILPRIMVRHNLEDGRLVPNKGSKATATTRKLLKRLEKDFGPIMFKKDLVDTGGYEPPAKYLGSNYNRGVAKVFEAQGHDPGTPKAGNLFVTQVSLNGTMYYDARMEGGRRMGPVVLRWGAKQ
jgi:hypothetical protein